MCMCSAPDKTVAISCAMNVFNICDVLICFFLFLFFSPTQLLPLFFASRFVGEDITVMSAFNLLHLVTKSQPVALRACGLPSGSHRDKKNCKVVFSQQELRKRLTPLQYHVTQENGTESAFEGEYTHHKDPGIYKCVVCGAPLFKSETKFDSGSGWPSFHDVISSEAITFTDDFSYGMHRVETSCSQILHLFQIEGLWQLCIKQVFGAIFPAACAHFMSLCRFLVILGIFHTF
ncbi:methionine-R-sulfoxide reductase B3 isoform X3 [Sapajus apella]|uniref:Peptide-methionine (R)-S-oxide reductase n=1 Tax=Sapajus apella TaxID=9515 RepID=A0A6J3INS7_SAPAP|nr:methionine-R-sulfoxide reductase B3 isoform X3 [Sapajus apella]